MSKNFELLRQIGNDSDIFQVLEEGSGPAEFVGKDSQVWDNAHESSTPPGGFHAAISFQQGNASAEACVLPAHGAIPGHSSPQIAIPSSGAQSAQLKSQSKRRVPLSKQRGSARQHQREVPLTGPIREAFRDKSATPFDVPASADEKVGSKDHGEPIVSPRTTRFRRWLERAAVYAGALGRKIARPRSFSRAERQALVQQEEIKLVYGLFPAEQKDSPRVVLFAGIECDCDSARICARTAELLAARGEGTVCAVDVNLRSPSLHQYFFMDNACGLAEAAMESGPIFSFARKVADSDLWLLPAGVSPSASNHHAMAERLKVRFAELRASFRYVIVHAGPLRYDSDSLLLSRWTDGVVLVVEADSTLRKSAGQLKESLASMQVGVLGVVLNNRRIELPEGLDCRL